MQNFFCFLILVALSSCGVAEGQIPEVVKKSFADKYPDEKSPKWMVDDNGNYEAQFKKKGEPYRADFDKNGNWIETENTIKYSNLPEPVKDAIKKDYDKDDIVEIERVEHPTKGLFFDIEFKKKGEKHDVEYNSSGTIIGRE